MAKNSKTGTLDFYRTRLGDETPLTMGVLIALAQADLTYKPHERSSTAGQIISAIIKGLEIRNSLVSEVLSLCVQRQTAAVRMFLGFFRFGILPFEVGKRHVQRFAANRIRKPLSPIIGH
jgi:hypothetical protein